MITIQSFCYSIPGIFCGLVVALILNMGLRCVVYSFADNALGYYLPIGALTIGITYGLVMPVLAVLLPIQSALGKNLRNSLDLNHRSNNEKSVSV